MASSVPQLRYTKKPTVILRFYEQIGSVELRPSKPFTVSETLLTQIESNAGVTRTNKLSGDKNPCFAVEYGFVEIQALVIYIKNLLELHGWEVCTLGDDLEPNSI